MHIHGWQVGVFGFGLVMSAVFVLIVSWLAIVIGWEWFTEQLWEAGDRVRRRRARTAQPPPGGKG